MKNVAYWVASAGFIAWTACFLVALNSGDGSAIGQFGDAFGVVNALFTMGAMIGAWPAVMYQHRELAESRANRASDEREQRFFQLIRLLTDSTTGVQIAEADDDYSRRGQLASGHRALKAALRTARDQDTHFRESVSGCSQWIEMVEAIIDFILVCDNENQREFFKCIFVAQLSFHQRRLLSEAVSGFSVITAYPTN